MNATCHWNLEHLSNFLVTVKLKVTPNHPQLNARLIKLSQHQMIWMVLESRSNQQCHSLDRWCDLMIKLTKNMCAMWKIALAVSRTKAVSIDTESHITARVKGIKRNWNSNDLFANFAKNQICIIVISNGIFLINTKKWIKLNAKIRFKMFI